MINIEITKQKIINFLKQKGPSLPIHISKKIQLSPMFTSAILAELTEIKKIKTSSLKIGSSPLYLLPGQEQELEKFTDNFGGIEKEALLKLKENKILKDEEQSPAIRVALHSIKDFAVSYQIQGKTLWKYTFPSKQESQKLTAKPKQDKPAQKQTPTPPRPTLPPAQPTPPAPTPQPTTQPSQPTTPPPSQTQPKKPEPIFDKPKPAPKPTPKPRKPNQNFLEEIKPFLEKKQIEILELEEVNKRKVIARVYIRSQPHLLAAFNKKRITELELIKIYRKSAELNIPYYILTKGPPTKKMQELSQAYKKLTKIDVLE